MSRLIPVAFHAPRMIPHRIAALAKWLVSLRESVNRWVIVNHFWESIFGIGIVRTSEEFGASGRSAVASRTARLVGDRVDEQKWNLKHLLKLMVTSPHTGGLLRVTPELLGKDPDNRLLARGPRFRLSAEMIRDQAMFVSGLLSRKMYGPPVKPLQPKLGISAAFGSGIDWETSSGEDVSPCDLHHLAAFQPLPVHGDVRCAQPRGLRSAGTFQHSIAGSRHSE
jgi:hypothetical protein